MARDPEALAVAFTYVPSEDDPTSGEVYYTAFSGADHDDPLTKAHNFARAEKARDDFPGSLWTVTGNPRSAEIRSDAWMKANGIV